MDIKKDLNQGLGRNGIRGNAWFRGMVSLAILAVVCLSGTVTVCTAKTKSTAETTRPVLENLRKKAAKSPRKASERVVLGYYPSWGTLMPDPFSLTHLSYAFATVDVTADGVTVVNPATLERVTHLKEKNPDLKILISIGGPGNEEKFGVMAADPKKRSQGIRSIMETVRKFGLDGVDIDWEMADMRWKKIDLFKPHQKNFAKLMKQLRDSLGKERVLTYCAGWRPHNWDPKKVQKYVDFINVMCYDMCNQGTGKYHHAPLKRSALTEVCSVEESVALYTSAGAQLDKMLIGVPFYGCGNKTDYDYQVPYRNMKLLPGMEYARDEADDAPYILKKETGELVLSYEDSVSLARKCRDFKDLGVRGICIWQIDADTNDFKLLRSIQDNFLDDAPTTK